MYKEKILLLGPRLKYKQNVGGIVVLFEDLITYCIEKNIKIKVIDTNLANYSNKVTGIVKVLYRFVINLKGSSHISLHGTANDFLVLSPIVVVLSKLFGKKVSMRKFAGSFYDVYLNSNIISRNIYNFVLKKTDVVFFETKYLVNKFRGKNSNTFWFPNSRKASRLVKTTLYQKKFVFISQVKKTKGIIEFIKLADYFDNSYTFDVYGPILEEGMEKKIKEAKNINYKGVLSPNEVNKTLVEYDFLVLPTYHKGEGYPGIIIEAFSCGVPVISTNWGAIPEIVNKSVGFIVMPKDIEGLKKAINSITYNNYREFSKNALNEFERFDRENINCFFLNKIK